MKNRVVITTNQILWTIILLNTSSDDWYIDYINDKLNYQIKLNDLEENINILILDKIEDIQDSENLGEYLNIINNGDISDNYIKTIYNNLEKTKKNCLCFSGIYKSKDGDYVFNQKEENSEEIFIPINKMNPIKKEFILKKFNNYIEGEFKKISAKFIDDILVYIDSDIDLNKTINQETKEPFSIILTAYKTEKFIEECLDSIESQTYFENNDNYEILVGVDGCENTLNKLNEIKDKYRNLYIYMMKENRGTYMTTNALLNLIKYENVIRFDTDDIMEPNLVEDLVDFKNINDDDVIKLGYSDWREGKKINDYVLVNDGIIYFKKSVMDDIAGGYMPWECAADSELISRLKGRVKISGLNKRLFIRRIHDNSLTLRKDTGYKSVKRLKYNNQIKGKYNDDEVKIERVSNEIKKIISENNLSNFTYIKNKVVHFDVIIKIISFSLENVNEILKHLFSEYTMYKFKVVIINKSKTDYSILKKNYSDIIIEENINLLSYKTHCIIEMRDLYMLNDNFIDTLMNNFFEIKNISNKYVSIDFSVDKNNYYEKLYDSQFLKKINNLDNEKISNEIKSQNLLTYIFTNKLFHIKENNIKITDEKVKILYIGRKISHIITGIATSGNMITRLLEEAGCHVIYIDSQDVDNFLKKKWDINVIWYYDDSRFNIDIIKTLQNIYGNNIPILINSVFNNLKEHTKEIINRLNILNSGVLNNVYFGVFTKEIENIKDFENHKNNIFAIPKTIISHNNVPPTFHERKNICLGEYNKFMNNSLTDNLNIYEIIFNLKKEFKDIDFYAFKHHSYDSSHFLHPRNSNKINNSNEIDYIENTIKIEGYKKDLIDWLKYFKIYISLNNNETFSMVPAEAQGIGTFVMFRNMPQSLNSYFYYSAYMWESIEDLIKAIKLVYYNEEVWNELSELSLSNYNTNSIKKLKFILRLQIEKLIIRHKKNIKNI